VGSSDVGADGVGVDVLVGALARVFEHAASIKPTNADGTAHL
jgi:hypothetical protein